MIQEKQTLSSLITQAHVQLESSTLKEAHSENHVALVTLSPVLSKKLFQMAVFTSLIL